MTDKINSVKVHSYTVPSHYLKSQGANNLEDVIVHAARVSNPSNQINFESSDKLVRYLIRNSHWSPFTMANVCLEIETPRDIARQMLRHSSIAPQEFSQRYADGTSLGLVVREARLQDEKNRQNSIELDDYSDHINEEWQSRQKKIIELVQKNYEWAIANGIAKECARVILPEGNTMSRMYMNGSIRSWIHYLQVRLHPSTQKEHRELAKKVYYAIAIEFPSLAAIMDLNGNMLLDNPKEKSKWWKRLTGIFTKN